MGVRACCQAGAESPFLCYYHINLRCRRGLDRGEQALALFSCLIPWLRTLPHACFVLLDVDDLGVGIPALLCEFVDRHHVKDRLIENVM